MKKILFLFIPLLFVACGEKEKEKVVQVKLNTAKDRLSYTLGAMNAKSIVGTPDPNIARLDMKEVSKGFNENLNNNKPNDCEATLIKLFGPNFQDFDSTYAKEGARCLGKLTGYAFYQDMVKMDGLNQIDLKMVKAGFLDGLMKRDNLVSDQDKQQLISKFLGDLTKKSGDKMISDAKLIEGAMIFDNDIVIETIVAGKGGSPSETDDVKIEYILLNSTGDTMQSSYAMKKMSGSTEPVALKLHNGVIPGWTFALPKMKKGGKYKLYVPWELAYGEQGMFNQQTKRYDIQPYESLMFVIELVDFAKEGEFVKPQPQQTMPQGQGF